EEGVLADQDVADPAGLGLTQAQVAEVGALGVERDVAPLAAGAAERGDLVHLIDERRDVLLLGLGDRVAELEELSVEVLELLRRGLSLPLEALLDAMEELQLLADDALAFGGEAAELVLDVALIGHDRLA